MKLSLITVTYNSVETLKETIHSVRNQKVKDLEYLVVDGGSQDGTVELLKNSADVVTSWVSEPDKGIYDAMNKGLKMATGDIIGFLHADDQYASRVILGDVIQSFQAGRTDFLYGDLEYITAQKPHRVVRYWQSGQFSHSRLKKGWMPPHPTVYFKRTILEQTGGFNTSYTISADYEWMLRCLKQPGLQVSYLPKVMVKMRLGGASNKSLWGIIRKSREDYRAITSNRIGGFWTLVFKNLGKADQFLKKNKSTL